MNFDQLITNISITDTALQTEAVKAINKALTVRNWLIGLHIVEFEQHGEDRAEYGTLLLQNLSDRLDKKGLSYRNLKLFRQFYQSYPALVEPIKAYLQQTNFGLKNSFQIGQTLSAQFESIDNKSVAISPDKILSQLSFGHLTELIQIKEPLKRTFYELECMKGVWTVRELRRQIHSLYFERMGLSTQPEKLAELVQNRSISTAFDQRRTHF
jgi:hypothetical protein